MFKNPTQSAQVLRRRQTSTWTEIMHYRNLFAKELPRPLCVGMGILSSASNRYPKLEQILILHLGTCRGGCLDRGNRPLHPALSGGGYVKWMFQFWVFGFILLTHEGSHREVYQEFQPSFDIFRWGCQRWFRPQVPCNPHLHCPIANSASTQYRTANQI